MVISDAPERLPTITDGGANRLTDVGYAAVVALNLAAVALAVWGVARRRSTHGLERWAVVASVAFLGDVWLTALHEDRFSLAFYLARLLGLAASAFVMLAVLRASALIQERTREVAKRLEERNAELVEATRLRDHLTAVVSHDLRTPLAGLQGYLEMLRDDDLDSPLARRMLDRSWMLTRRLTLLTEDLLAAATFEYGDLVVTPEVLELNQQLVECATCFPDLDLELDCPPGLAAYADPLRLQQILANLVRNAQKHGAEPVLHRRRSRPGRPGRRHDPRLRRRPRRAGDVHPAALRALQPGQRHRHRWLRARSLRGPRPGQRPPRHRPLRPRRQRLRLHPPARVVVRRDEGR